MTLPDEASRLTHFAYALRELDSRRFDDETPVSCLQLADCPRTDLTLCALFLRDNVGEPAENDSGIYPCRTDDNRLPVSQESKQRFIRLLLRGVRAHEGLSREDRTFIRQFWRALDPRP